MNEKFILNPTDYTQEEWYKMFMGAVETNHNLQSKIDKTIEFVEEYKKQWVENDEVVNDMNNLENILKEDK